MLVFCLWWVFKKFVPLLMLVCFEAPLSYASLAVPPLLHLRLHLLHHLTVCSVLYPIQFCCYNLVTLTDLCFFTSTHCCEPYKLVESGLATHCPCKLKNWTCFMETNPHVLCAHSAVHVHVQLNDCSISSVSNVRILFIQNHDVSSSNDFLHLDEV